MASRNCLIGISKACLKLTRVEFFNSLILDGHNKIQSTLKSTKEEREHIEENIKNVAVRKKKLDEELNASFKKMHL